MDEHLHEALFLLLDQQDELQEAIKSLDDRIAAAHAALERVDAALGEVPDRQLRRVRNEYESARAKRRRQREKERAQREEREYWRPLRAP